MIDSYNPQKAPNPKEWLALGEQKRIELVNQYHFNHEADIPNLQMHSVMHNIVENQVAMGDEIPVKKTLDRLVKEGLDRHEAIHAIGSVLLQYMFSITQDGTNGDHSHNEYYEKLKSLTADNWVDELG